MHLNAGWVIIDTFHDYFLIKKPSNTSLKKKTFKFLNIKKSIGVLQTLALSAK